MVRTVRAHLHLSLAARLGRVLGAPLSLYPGAGSARWRGLCALARTRGPLRVVRGPVAVGLWVPGIVLGKGTRPPLVLSGQPLGSLRREYPLWHLDLANSQPADRLVPIPVPGARRPVLVAVPEAVAAVEPEDAPALRMRPGCCTRRGGVMRQPDVCRHTARATRGGRRTTSVRTTGLPACAVFRRPPTSEPGAWAHRDRCRRRSVAGAWSPTRRRSSGPAGDGDRDERRAHERRTAPRSKRTGTSSWAKPQEAASRSGRQRFHCTVCRKRVPSMWS